MHLHAPTHARASLPPAFRPLQLAGPEAAQAHGLDLYSVCSVVGYCLAPMTVLSALTLLLPR